MAKELPPIVIKKVVYDEDCAHGGAWKIAFADLMTAVMAFFLLLWVLSGTNDEEKKIIAEYFKDPTVFEGQKDQFIPEKNLGRTNSVIDDGGHQDIPLSRVGETSENKIVKPVDSDKTLEELHRKLESLFKEESNMLITQDDQGVHIEIRDERGKSLFDVGSSDIKPDGVILLKKIAQSFEGLPFMLTITGHTDALKFKDDIYDNYDLSVDRAQSARKVLIENGVNGALFNAIIGKASTKLVVEDGVTPYSPKQRRIVIDVMEAK